MSKKRPSYEAYEASTSVNQEPKSQSKRLKGDSGGTEVSEAVKVLKELAAALQPVSERLEAIGDRRYESGRRVEDVSALCEAAFAETALWADRAKGLYRAVQRQRGRATKEELCEDEVDVAAEKERLLSLSKGDPEEPLAKDASASFCSAFQKIVSQMDERLREAEGREWLTGTGEQITTEEVCLLEFNLTYVRNQIEVLEALAKDLLSEPDPTRDIPLPYTKYFSSDCKPEQELPKDSHPPSHEQEFQPKDKPDV
ncbi:uncharacterized protein LOC122246533 [Penaeus japonicus]|uniref:uncharacterized protein LOC122246533 n=1 Tax=Penaeus japonicus TaxID=27405 RepID=UPI001C70B794|nr:uncharacterized protein LOC122246533 [Penaeus japonicus]